MCVWFLFYHYPALNLLPSLYSCVRSPLLRKLLTSNCPSSLGTVCVATSCLILWKLLHVDTLMFMTLDKRGPGDEFIMNLICFFFYLRPTISLASFFPPEENVVGVTFSYNGMTKFNTCTSQKVNQKYACCDYVLCPTGGIRAD